MAPAKDNKSKKDSAEESVAPGKDKKSKKDSTVVDHLKMADFATGDEDVTSIDVKKLTPLAAAQLRGALGIQEPANPQIEALQQSVEGLKSKVDAVAVQMQVDSTPCTAHPTHVCSCTVPHKTACRRFLLRPQSRARAPPPTSQSS